MYYSKYMWRIIRWAYIFHRVPKIYITKLTNEVSTTVPKFYRRKILLRHNTVEFKFKYRWVKKKLCGYPLHKFGFWDKKNYKINWLIKKKRRKGFSKIKLVIKKKTGKLGYNGSNW